jgi:hypothetical protein
MSCCGLLLDGCGNILESFGLQVNYHYIPFSFFRVKVICQV